jgi:hypothetical protein
MISKNNLFLDDGNIYFDINKESLTPGIFHFAGALSKICNMDILNRETIRSMFYELLHENIKQFAEYAPKEHYSPTMDSDLAVDYAFLSAKNKPLYVFGIQDSNKAKKTTIACLTYKNKKMPFRSVMIHEDFDKLTKYDRNQLTNIADKQFTSLDEFKDLGKDYILSEIA